jgi:hypothetical protein
MSDTSVKVHKTEIIDACIRRDCDMGCNEYSITDARRWRDKGTGMNDGRGFPILGRTMLVDQQFPLHIGDTDMVSNFAIPGFGFPTNLRFECLDGKESAFNARERISRHHRSRLRNLLRGPISKNYQCRHKKKYRLAGRGKN